MKLLKDLETLLKNIDKMASIKLIKNKKTKDLSAIELFFQGKSQEINIERDSMLQIIKDVVEKV